jgi:magnesium transporter
VAFCFYNLSSIVNGLIYFDQVSLLPVSHLLLVTVGIIVLLGGVWAVSLQAVDVGTWTSSDDVDITVVEDGVTNETPLPECEPTLTQAVPQECEHTRSRAETVASPPPRSPLSPRRHALHHLPRQSSLGGTIPVGSPPSAVPAPGFSIGLSPASPGFVIVPRERRRCVSSQSQGDPWDEVVRHVRTRRIVSDDNVLPGDEVEHGHDGAGEDGRIDSGGRTIQARGRWRWLRDLTLTLGRQSGS